MTPGGRNSAGNGQEVPTVSGAGGNFGEEAKPGEIGEVPVKSGGGAEQPWGMVRARAGKLRLIPLCGEARLRWGGRCALCAVNGLSPFLGSLWGAPLGAPFCD